MKSLQEGTLILVTSITRQYELVSVSSPASKIVGDVLTVEDFEIFSCNLVAHATLATLFRSAETRIEDIVSCQSLKLGATVVPGQLVSSLDGPHCEEIEGTEIVVFDATVSVAAVVDQNCR